ncbi:UDP-2,4-diacetamido-2,4,6-trideoxy-beta-L-altropyranose hydrolase [bacterium]|nr:UDP-2,4-diacetamido-2,4,6-trideoxy-beta-L-altropyranose hydrolase [bacterium]MBU1990604.1 UDP-2,4-diacetamido-2,4,6-trideoxy-beta-L-altropyranose hydrolase [bacterium]
MKTILFRADSSSDIGTGHIMRDLVLASQFKKKFPHAEIFFAAQDLDGNINHKIVDAGYELKRVTSNAKEELLELIRTRHVEMLVIDHYGIDYNYESFLKNNSNIKIFSLDDTYEKHDCDILLNHNISADKKRYKGLVPEGCELRCGAKYTLLRDEFNKEKKKKKKANKEKTIFLAMGGADHSNINIEILKVLKAFKNIKVKLVTTSANKNIKALKGYAQNKKWITLHINSNSIAKLMRKSDVALITPSVTLNEVYYMGLPFIAIKTASNQNEIYEYLKKKKFLTLSRFDRHKLKSKLKTLLKKIQNA